MASSPKFRPFTPVIAGLLPAAVTLAVLSARGAVSPLISLLVIIASFAFGFLWSTAAAGAWTRRAERLDAVATALAARRPPTHLLP
ncbi:MAG TPA: hypothetical protein VEJ86_00335, partial [Candidatus Binataceae bacterium]|nr:hypothetical protein [Candidatus Binataceae bacterium]